MSNDTDDKEIERMLAAVKTLSANDQRTLMTLFNMIRSGTYEVLTLVAKPTGTEFSSDESYWGSLWCFDSGGEMILRNPSGGMLGVAVVLRPDGGIESVISVPQAIWQQLKTRARDSSH